ncbi:MAG: metallophosphoesterase family protein [Cyanobacteria bacterium SBLK]|nr:metallophosphoesterase family protein [Cyanobacteria bacterium SBLK]
MSDRSSQLLQRVGVIGDIHGEAKFLAIALKYLQAQKLDCLLCVGDIVDGRGNSDRCCQLLQQYRVWTVRGNHDRWLLGKEMRDLPDATQVTDISESSYHFLSNLPPTHAFLTVAGSLLLCHGIGDRDMVRLLPDDWGYALESNFELQDLIRSHQYNFVINGHTHRRMVRKFEHLTIINAGTLKSTHHPCFAIVDFSLGWVQFFDLWENTEIQESNCFEIK